MTKNRKLVAIHQPNFFPWLGFFDKIARADVFLLMDNVQLPKKGGTWSNRVQLMVNRKAAWITMPVMRSFHGTRMIKDIEIDNSLPWRQKILGSVQANYARAPFFNQIFPFLIELINNPTNNLTEYNETAIRTITSAIGLDASKLVKGSAINAGGTATELLINMTHAVGGTAYLAGGGAAGYQEDDKFSNEGVELIYQNFKHPVYYQHNNPEFLPGLSIIDSLMNIGFQGVKTIFSDNTSISRG
jgi:hypothetical protein